LRYAGLTERAGEMMEKGVGVVKQTLESSSS
jgi:hypothetical protein